MAIPLNLKDQNICILGLGYAGLTLAVAMADAGFRVHGAERRNDVIESLTRGEPHFWEPRLRDKLRRVIGEGHLTFSRSIDPAFRASVYVITVGTPLGPSGKPSFEAVQHAACEVADHMDDGSLIILPRPSPRHDTKHSYALRRCYWSPLRHCGLPGADS